MEVCVNGEWGTVCDDAWGDSDATVVCRQLGYGTDNVVPRMSAFFGQGTVPILLDDVLCAGSETQLINCPYTALHNCFHSEDAGVTCPGTQVPYCNIVKP